MCYFLPSIKLKLLIKNNFLLIHNKFLLIFILTDAIVFLQKL